MHALANLREHRRVRPRTRRHSIGSQAALGRGRHPRAQVERTVGKLVDRVALRMRKAGRPGRTLILRLRLGDYSRSSRSLTLPRATASTESLLAAAARLLDEAQPIIRERGLTLVGVTVSNLDDTSAGVQLELPLQRRGAEALDAAVDDLRERFGSASIARGAGGALREGPHASAVRT